MNEDLLENIRRLLSQCTEEERKTLFNHLRKNITLHPLETSFGAPAELILEAIHRAPELTRRMLRGVIADAAFAQFVIPALGADGWEDVTPEGNFSFDHMLQDGAGQVSVQVKLQRSEGGTPVITTGTRYGLAADMFMVETQKTRTGNSVGQDGESQKTRPYRFGEFDILAVSLWPSNGQWEAFRYTVGSWLLQGHNPNEIATYQPVARVTNADWTDDFNMAAQWFRAASIKKIAGAR